MPGPVRPGFRSAGSPGFRQSKDALRAPDVRRLNQASGEKRGADRGVAPARCQDLFCPSDFGWGWAEDSVDRADLGRVDRCHAVKARPSCAGSCLGQAILIGYHEVGAVEGVDSCGARGHKHLAPGEVQGGCARRWRTAKISGQVGRAEHQRCDEWVAASDVGRGYDAGTTLDHRHQTDRAWLDIVQGGKAPYEPRCLLGGLRARHFGQEDRIRSAGNEFQQVANAHIGQDVVDADDCLNATSPPRAQPGSNLVAREFLPVEGYRVLQIENQGIRTATGCFVQHALLVARDI